MNNEFMQLQKELEKSIKNMYYYQSRNYNCKHYLELYNKSTKYLKTFCEDLVAEIINEEKEIYE